jgi:ubiquinone/menaquinone biosynthesis C-methylase UbiE
MESDEESLRLDLKTDPDTIKRQALWAGLKPGMHVADLGCGPGKTSFYLNQLIQPAGSVLGLDISSQRINYALSHYQSEGVHYVLADMREALDDLGEFDFVWIRFVLEHYRSTSFDIVSNVSKVLKRNGILCLIDLDYNCLTHCGISPRLETAMFGIMEILKEKSDFDPYSGRRLYSYLFDLGFKAINVDISMHHLFFGRLPETDAYNWGRKIEIAARNSGYTFDEYEDGFEGFRREFDTFLSDPRRFSYTPVITCRGQKP